MNQRLTYIGLMLYSACYALMFGTWAALVFNKVPDAQQFITYIQIALGTLSGHVLTLLGQRPGASDAPAPGGQGGFARVGIMAFLATTAVLAFALAGCATTAGGTPQTPQQVASRVCPAVQITVTNLAMIDGLEVDAKTALENAQPVIAAVCSAAAVDVGNLRSLAETALPVLVKLADGAPLPPEQKSQLMIGLTAGQIVLSGVL